MHLPPTERSTRSIVIDFFESLAKQQTGAGIRVGFLYIRYSDSLNLTVHHCLEVLVKQTVEKCPECYKLAEELYREHIRLKTRPTEVELLHLLQVFATLEGETFYFVDALDEAPPKVQLSLLKALLTLNVKLFITSRPLKLLETQILDADHFEISARPRDIDLHVVEEMSKSPELCRLMQERGPTWKEEILTLIKLRCCGM